MYIASHKSRKGRDVGPACSDREEAAAAFFAKFPDQKCCATSDAFDRNGTWIERHTNIQFINRPYGE